MILVVDDYGPARELYASLFHAAGYRVEEAATGKEAIEKGFRLLPDLILMDLLLPGMSGLDVIQRFKADERTRNRLTVVITGAPRDERARDAHVVGCDAYLVKPVLPEALLRLVRDLLNRTATSTQPATER